MGLSKEDVKNFGSLSCKATWLTAIGTAIAPEFESTETVEAIAVQPNDNPTTEPEVTEIACLIDHPVLAEGELREPADGSIYLGSDDRGLPTYWGLFDSDGDKLDIYSLKESGPITPLITIGNVEKKLLTWVSPSATPLRDELTQQMADYVGDCISPEEFEALQNEPLDEYTAAVYLGWLEESKRMLVEAMAA